VRGEAERLVGFEALIRWNHPRHGLVGPAAFVPVAEETGMIIALGAWVVRRACEQLLALAPNGPDAPWVSVNIAARQLADRALVDMVDAALRDSGLEPTRLKLEVTENVVLSDEDGARAALEKLRARGVRSYMDDFGTGHASLSYLHRLPIGTIKIDRYFVGRMDVSPECLEIVRSVITLARSLGMEVVAEGVEQQAHLTQLRTLGCEYAQGNLLARPKQALDAGELLRARLPGLATALPVLPGLPPRPMPPASNAATPA
jgi:EAL domain-containing protein (putative c-di-GMP-specific phosphodiesterase class I)